MDFLNIYASTILKDLNTQIIELEESIIKKGIFATKREKKRLEKLSNLYDEKLDWYTRMLELEMNSQKNID